MLEVLVSMLYFVNKVFLLFNEKAGWLIGALASGVAIFYFLGINLYIFCALEVACFCIMLYGLLGKQDSKRVAKVIYGVCALVTFYLMLSIRDTGVLEFLTSLLFILAFLSLADKYPRRGWLSLAIAHAIMAYITIVKGQYFFASMQAASVLVSILGSLYPSLKLMDLKKQFSPNKN